MPANSQVLTESQLVVARAKLPDDLTLPEFVDLSAAIQRLSVAARTRTATLYNARLEVEKVQYGSDFLMVLGIVSLTGAAVTSVGGAFLGLAKGIKLLTEAGVANEIRLEKREKRLARRTERLLLTRRIEAEERKREARGRAGESTLRDLNALVPEALRRDIAAAIGGELRSDVYVALVQLAEYDVDIQVVRRDQF